MCKIDDSICEFFYINELFRGKSSGWVGGGMVVPLSDSITFPLMIHLIFFLCPGGLFFQQKMHQIPFRRKEQLTNFDDQRDRYAIQH